MKRIVNRIFWVVCAALVLSTGYAQAEDSGRKVPLAFQLVGSFVAVSPSALGAELGGVLLLTPISGRGLQFGPRISGMLASGDTGLRADMYSGFEGTYWIANAFGPGFGLDLAVPCYEERGDNSAHFRFESHFSARLKRFKDNGAWAARAGVLYDTRYNWGVKLGLSWQFGGVPSIGDSPDEE